MKLAVVHNLPPGGMKRVLFEQVKRLSKKHTIDLFTLSCTDEKYLSLRPFVRHHEIMEYQPPGHFPQSILSIYFKLPNVYKKIAQKINVGGYNAAYVCPCYLTQAPYVLSYLTIPSVYYCPEPRREFYEKIPRVSNFLTYNLTYPFRLPLKIIDKNNIKKADIVLTDSRFCKENISRIYKIKSYVNYPGVDTDKFYPQVAPQGSPCMPATPGVSAGSNNIVLTVGDISLIKGHDFIIRSLAKVDTSILPKLVIVGHGGIEKEYLMKLARAFGVKIEIKENITDEELVKLYNRARLFLYTPHNEPFGMVLLESAACGTPIVAVNEGGVGEIVNDKLLGELTERDEIKFSEVIEKYLRKNENIKKRTRRYEYVRENWSWEKSVKELEDTLSRLHLC